MPQTVITNKFGKLAGWNDLTVNLFGRDLEGVTKLEYNDNVEWENIYGAGKMPIGEGEGNYEASASMSILAEELIALQSSLPDGTRLQDVKGTITHLFEYNNQVYKTIIYNVRILNPNISANQGDKSLSVDLDLKVSHIEWFKQ